MRVVGDLVEGASSTLARTDVADLIAAAEGVAPSRRAGREVPELAATPGDTGEMIDATARAA